MPVRRLDHQHATVNPSRSTDDVTGHYVGKIPLEMSHGPTLKLQSSITEAKGDRFASKASFTHRTGIISTLNDSHATGPDADAELLQSANALKGVEKCCSPAAKNKLKACGSLTTSRAAYQDLLTGEDGESKAYVRGKSCKPEQFHELPYGRECAFVIGDKATIYRDDFCNTATMQARMTEGHCPDSPRLVPVTQHATQQNLTGNVNQKYGRRGNCRGSPRDTTGADSNNGTLLGTSPRRHGETFGTTTPSPRYHSSVVAAPNNEQQKDGTNSAREVNPVGAGYNVFSGSQLNGSEKAERAVDTQTRREIESLTLSAHKRLDGAITMRNTAETVLTPRSRKLQEFETQAALRNQSAREQQQQIGSGTNVIRAIPQPPPSPRKGSATDANTLRSSPNGDTNFPSPLNVADVTSSNSARIPSAASSSNNNSNRIHPQGNTSSSAYGGGYRNSPRRLPIINRATMDAQIPPSPRSQAGGDDRTLLKNLLNTRQ